jgi:radical SAM protein (TIGR04043 family)
VNSEEQQLLTTEARRALFAELQAVGVVHDPSEDAPAGGEAGASVAESSPASGRRGGAGPSDHRALSLADTTIMVPMRAPGTSPYRLRVLTSRDPAAATRTVLFRGDEAIAPLEVPATPRFYALHTADGIPYPKIALLHARRVLASTVIQSCIRYTDPAQACRFCSIGTSLKEGRTLARKTPAQLAEVAEAAVRLDGVEQLVLTTGTPATADRGAAHLAACTAAVKRAVPDLPIQVQCEPPADLEWFERLRAAGVDTLGMHLEAVEPAVRAAVMPGKASVGVEDYFTAFAAAVAVFGRGQVSTYLIAGLGDSPASLLAVSERLLKIGVYPFVVPFVPIAGTPMAAHVPPSGASMHALYTAVARLTTAHGIWSRDMKAGCGKCGACSAQASFEAAS